MCIIYFLLFSQSTTKIIVNMFYVKIKNYLWPLPKNVFCKIMLIFLIPMLGFLEALIKALKKF